MSRLRHSQLGVELFKLLAGRGSTSHLLDSLLCQFPCLDIPELTSFVDVALGKEITSVGLTSVPGGSGDIPAGSGVLH
ncbi:hypothetical protein CROQUDRAFT_102307 [Cronartium quercuum f. sp. fusiforme G11]|uniref:Uncharacterized protein n=1 Tax=Cronartium quercuum f. sp. fusiforme G11 TaxID=708437 RepID=A0A9P6T644_9BASI|nr:hypothetical protein CROQUDRAFT_102307 [Cronartium quercuum f. sp. fusiforme G11]